MTAAGKLDQLLQITQMRREAQARRVAAAQAAAAAAHGVLAKAEADKAALAGQIAGLKADARTAFMGAPQTGALVERMLDGNRAYDARLVAADETIAAASADAQARDADVQAALTDLAALERQFEKRSTVQAQVAKARRRQVELKAEERLAEDLAGRPAG